jgi:predicted nucleic acid-binding protein
MKAFLDTSVLVAAFYGDHPHHDASLHVLTRFPKKDAACGAHSLVEVYSSLTRMPGRHRISGEQAMLFITDVRERLTVIALTRDEYFESLESDAKLGVVGGTIYDAILARCALKVRAEKLFTWNARHFEHFGPAITQLLETPS